jgi:hypothetical protein
LVNNSCAPPYVSETRSEAVTRMTDWTLSLQVLLLLGVANGTPIIAKSCSKAVSVHHLIVA